MSENSDRSGCLKLLLQFALWCSIPLALCGGVVLWMGGSASTAFLDMGVGGMALSTLLLGLMMLVFKSSNSGHTAGFAAGFAGIGLGLLGSIMAIISLGCLMVYGVGCLLH